MFQSNAIDFKKVSANEPILCIPGVFSNIREERILRVFADLNLGEVEKIDIVTPKRPAVPGENEKENKFNRVFIHINWNQEDQTTAARERLLQGKDIKIIYDEPWFWRVSAYRPPAPKPKFESQSANSKPKFQPKKATILLDYEPEVKNYGLIAPGLTSIIAPCLSIQNPVEPKTSVAPPQRKKKTIIN
jgi:hypothetical protein